MDLTGLDQMVETSVVDGSRVIALQLICDACDARVAEQSRTGAMLEFALDSCGIHDLGCLVAVALMSWLFLHSGAGLRSIANSTSWALSLHSSVRVGYIGADFCDHPVAFFANCLLEHYDSSRLPKTAWARREQLQSRRRGKNDLRIDMIKISIYIHNIRVIELL
eukprot:6136628-Amphidinium_carterae.1